MTSLAQSLSNARLPSGQRGICPGGEPGNISYPGPVSPLPRLFLSASAAWENYSTGGLPGKRRPEGEALNRAMLVSVHGRPNAPSHILFHKKSVQADHLSSKVQRNGSMSKSQTASDFLDRSDKAFSYRLHYYD